MKLKRYNPGNTRQIRKSKPTIRFVKQGQIAFSSIIAVAMGLKVGDRVDFVQDEDEPTDWYVIKTSEGFVLRAYKDANGLLTSSSAMVSKFLSSLGRDEKSVGCLVASEPTEVDGEDYWAIITSSAT